VEIRGGRAPTEESVIEGRGLQMLKERRPQTSLGEEIMREADPGIGGVGMRGQGRGRQRLGGTVQDHVTGVEWSVEGMLTREDQQLLTEE